MDKRNSIPLPTRAEKDQAISFILDTGLPQAQRARIPWAHLFSELPLSVLFFGVGDCLFLAALLTALCLVPAAAAAAREISPAPLLFLLSPLLYALLQLLTMWKDTMSRTLEWKQTCRVSLRMLTALRMLVFGGVSVAVCVPVNVLLWSVSGRRFPLLWMLGLSFSSLFLYAALTLCCQRLRPRWASFAAPLFWVLLGIFLMCWPYASAFLAEIPTAVFFLLTAGSLIFDLSELKRTILFSVQGGIRDAVC